MLKNSSYLAADIVVALDAVMAANTVHDALRGRDRLPGRPTANQLHARNAVPATTTSQVAEKGRGADCLSIPDLISQGFLWPCSRQSHRKARLELFFNTFFLS